MKRAIKNHIKDFLAIAGMVVLALTVLLVILANQKAALPGWVPGLGQNFYSLNAEFETAQAITPGQGQLAVISGINVGKVGAAELVDGVAQVRLDIEPKYRELIHEDAEFLIRPKTGLNDMVVEIDPGTSGPSPEDGAVLPLAQGMSNIQLEQFWGTLDRDTQDYLVLLLNNAGAGLNNKGKELSQTLRRFGPFAKYSAKLNGELQKRRHNIGNSVTAFSKIATELGQNDQAVADFVTNSKNSLGAFADEEAALRAALVEFPPTLASAKDALGKSNQVSLVMRPTLLKLLPGVKKLKPSLVSVQKLAKSTTPTIRDDIRPFTVDVRPVFDELVKTSKASAITTKAQRGFFGEINTLLDTLAYNPPGPQQEGFLFWAPWMAHNLNSSISFQDASGPVRRGISMINCNTATIADALGTTNQFLRSAYQMVQLPAPATIC